MSASPRGDLDLLPDDVEDDLRATLGSLLAQRCPPGRVVAAYDGDDSLAASLWPALVDLGLPALLVPDEHGGAGAGPREAAAVLDVLARHAAPVPYLSSAVVATATLVALAGDEGLLAELAEGAVAALLVPATTHRAADVVPLEVAGDGTVAGSVRAVPGVVGGAPADLLLVPVTTPGGPGVAAVRTDAAGVRVDPVVSLDMTSPLADVRLDRADATLLPGDAPAAVGRGLGAGSALAASALAGTAAWALSATVAHLGERRQFGRVVGGYQALKHRLADLHGEVGSATAAARHAAAARAVLAPDDPEVAISTAVAKAWCSEVAVHATEEAVQLHGGIAMTWEHPCHLHLKRARAGSLVLGPPARAPRRPDRPPGPTAAPPRAGRITPMDLSLTDEQQSFRDLAREFLDKEAVPHRIEWDRREAVDLDIVPKMAEIGFFGLTIPEEHGGLGGDYVTYALAMEELGRADSALRGIVSVSSGLVGKSILFFGSDEQKAEWLPQLATAARLGCFGLTEPGTGSDAGNLTSRARRDGDDWLITGQKLYITNGTWADVALVFARTGGDGPKGVSAFLVPTDAPGFEAREIKGKLGLRGQATAELFLDDVRVPSSAMLGEEGQGFTIAMSTLDKGRLAVAAGCVGIVQGCLESAVEYATSRTQFGRQIAGFQMVQDMIADISLDADAARLLVWRCADLVDRGEPFRTAASKAKLYASEAAVRAANLAIQVHGGAGYVDEYPPSKYLRDARVMTLYEGTSQIQKLLIGRAETGVSAFV